MSEAVKEATFEYIWRTLSAIDVSAKVQQKNGLNYLSWSYAWSILMEEFPDAEYKFKPPVFFEDGTCEVWVKLTIGSVSRKMWLPVMNHKGQAIPKPDAVAINKARMRALVKACAMFGLGRYIYSGEDLPELRGQTTGRLLDFDKITTAYAFFKKMIDDDNEEYQKMQDAAANLNMDNADYMIEVMNHFGKEKCEGHPNKRQYKNILADILKTPLDSNGNLLPPEEPEDEPA